MVSGLLKTLGVLIGALIIGLGVTWLSINAGVGTALQNGAWTTDPAIGSQTASPYARAALARAGLLALNKSEAVYFTAVQDDAGEPLTSKCSYRLEGTPLATRWWSITAYGADHFLIPNPADRYSQAMNTVTRDTENGFTISVNPDGKGTNAIPTGFDGTGEGSAFSLSLRLYNPDEETYSNLENLQLPTIVKEACS